MSIFTLSTFNLLATCKSLSKLYNWHIFYITTVTKNTVHVLFYKKINQSKIKRERVSSKVSNMSPCNYISERLIPHTTEKLQMYFNNGSASILNSKVSNT